MSCSSSSQAPQLLRPGLWARLPPSAWGSRCPAGTTESLRPEAPPLGLLPSPAPALHLPVGPHRPLSHGSSDPASPRPKPLLLLPPVLSESGPFSGTSALRRASQSLLSVSETPRRRPLGGARSWGVALREGSVPLRRGPRSAPRPSLYVRTRQERASVNQPSRRRIRDAFPRTSSPRALSGKCLLFTSPPACGVLLQR